jgi:hypothetical protein
MIELITQEYSGGVPALALIAEGMALIVYAYLMIRLGTKWYQRRRVATFNLFLSFTFYFIAILTLFSTKSTDFLTGDELVADLGINLGYAFSLIGNIFLFYFTENIFYEKPHRYLREFITFGNGITFGFLMIFCFQVQEFPFLQIPTQYIPTHFLIWHVIISSLGFLILLKSAFQSSFNAKEKLPKAGFLMIGFSAIFELLVFVFFFVDRFVGGGFTQWYFLAWLSASLAGLFSMTGFLMPNWFKKILGE